MSHSLNLATPRFALRQLVATDIANVFKGLSDPEITRYYDVHFESLTHTQEQMQWFSDLEENGTGQWWAICDIESGQFLGAAGFSNIQRTHKKAEIGFWLLKENWGKGIIKDVVPTLLQYAFEVLGLHRIEAYVESDNKNSYRVLTKLDFECEGRMREVEYKNGQFIDVYLFATLAA